MGDCMLEPHGMGFIWGGVLFFVFLYKDQSEPALNMTVVIYLNVLESLPLNQEGPDIIPHSSTAMYLKVLVLSIP